MSSGVIRTRRGPTRRDGRRPCSIHARTVRGLTPSSSAADLTSKKCEGIAHELAIHESQIAIAVPRQVHLIRACNSSSPWAERRTGLPIEVVQETVSGYWMGRVTDMPYPLTVTRSIDDQDKAAPWLLIDGDALERRSGRTFTFTDPDRARRVTIELGVVDGKWEAIGIDARSYGPLAQETVSPLTVRELRAWPLGELIERAGVELGAVLSDVVEKEHGGEAFRDRLGQRRISITGAGAKRGLEKLGAPRRRSKRIPPALLERAAQIYREEAVLPAGTPTKAVADDAGIPRSTASNWVRRCRDLGLI